MQPDQRVHMKRIKANGGLHYCPRTLDEFIQIIDELKRKEDE